MKHLSKKIEMIANLAIILVAMLLTIAIVERYRFVPKAPNTSPVAGVPTQPGTKLSLPGVDWSKSERTLVMVLSTGCHFCSESAPFYQRLAQEKTRRGGIRIVAVLPQDTADVQKYLSEHGVSVDEIKHLSPGEVQVSGTPTLILADRNGSVVATWLGKLPPDKEGEVLSRL
jgi:hypothetical protein